MLKKLLNGTVYVKVSTNQFWVRDVVGKKEVTVSALEPFTTQRLLVGEFSTAKRYLEQGVKKVYEGRWFSVAPVMVIQALEMTEGGLSEVEERILRELAVSVGARRVFVWVGYELSDQEVLQCAKNA